MPWARFTAQLRYRAVVVWRVVKGTPTLRKQRRRARENKPSQALFPSGMSQGNKALRAQHTVIFLRGKARRAALGRANGSFWSPIQKPIGSATRSVRAI